MPLTPEKANELQELLNEGGLSPAMQKKVEAALAGPIEGEMGTPGQSIVGPAQSGSSPQSAPDEQEEELVTRLPDSPFGTYPPGQMGLRERNASLAALPVPDELSMGPEFQQRSAEAQEQAALKAHQMQDPLAGLDPGSPEFDVALDDMGLQNLVDLEARYAADSATGAWDIYRPPVLEGDGEPEILDEPSAAAARRFYAENPQIAEKWGVARDLETDGTLWYDDPAYKLYADHVWKGRYDLRRKTGRAAIRRDYAGDALSPGQKRWHDAQLQAKGLAAGMDYGLTAGLGQTVLGGMADLFQKNVRESEGETFDQSAARFYHEDPPLLTTGVGKSALRGLEGMFRRGVEPLDLDAREVIPGRTSAYPLPPLEEGGAVEDLRQARERTTGGWIGAPIGGLFGVGAAMQKALPRLLPKASTKWGRAGIEGLGAGVGAGLESGAAVSLEGEPEQAPAAAALGFAGGTLLGVPLSRLGIGATDQNLQQLMDDAGPYPGFGSDLQTLAGIDKPSIRGFVNPLKQTQAMLDAKAAAWTTGQAPLPGPAETAQRHLQGTVAQDVLDEFSAYAQQNYAKRAANKAAYANLPEMTQRPIRLQRDMLELFEEHLRRTQTPADLGEQAYVDPLVNVQRTIPGGESLASEAVALWRKSVQVRKMPLADYQALRKGGGADAIYRTLRPEEVLQSQEVIEQLTPAPRGSTLGSTVAPSSRDEITKGIAIGQHKQMLDLAQDVNRKMFVASGAAPPATRRGAGAVNELLPGPHDLADTSPGPLSWMMRQDIPEGTLTESQLRRERLGYGAPPPWTRRGPGAVNEHLADTTPGSDPAGLDISPGMEADFLRPHAKDPTQLWLEKKRLELAPRDKFHVGRNGRVYFNDDFSDLQASWRWEFGRAQKRAVLAEYSAKENGIDQEVLGDVHEQLWKHRADGRPYAPPPIDPIAQLRDREVVKIAEHVQEACQMEALGDDVLDLYVDELQGELLPAEYAAFKDAARNIGLRVDPPEPSVRSGELIEEPVSVTASPMERKPGADLPAVDLGYSDEEYRKVLAQGLDYAPGGTLLSAKPARMPFTRLPKEGEITGPTGIGRPERRGLGDTLREGEIPYTPTERQLPAPQPELQPDTLVADDGFVYIIEPRQLNGTNLLELLDVAADKSRAFIGKHPGASGDPIWKPFHAKLRELFAREFPAADAMRKENARLGDEFRYRSKLLLGSEVGERFKANDPALRKRVQDIIAEPGALGGASVEAEAREMAAELAGVRPGDLPAEQKLLMARQMEALDRMKRRRAELPGGYSMGGRFYGNLAQMFKGPRAALRYRMMRNYLGDPDSLSLAPPMGLGLGLGRPDLGIEEE